MAKLLIVESPSKAKTIGNYLGKEYHVLASYGHIRNLLPKSQGVDTNDFAMKYEIGSRSKKYIDAISKAAKNSDEILLATDPDREGEAIAWHILEVLNTKKIIKGKKISRIIFGEITKSAIIDALSNPREIAQALVQAQQARQALDYLIGFNLSPLLWSKIRYGLSAGRVQSPALRLIVEREEEIDAFESKEYWSIHLDATKNKAKIPSKLSILNNEKLEQFTITSAAQEKKIVGELLLKSSGKVSVSRVDKKQRTRNPAAPFTTSTLQQQAVRKLGFTTRGTMMTAQQLYEGINISEGTVGLITYMRTDSMSLSNESTSQIRKYLETNYAKEFFPQKAIGYKTKAKNAQEAHEAIRPTNIERTPQSLKPYLSEQQFKLYEIIWKRTLACQMSPAIFDAVSIDLEVGQGESVFRATGQTLKFAGFMSVYLEEQDESQKDDTETSIFPDLEVGETLLVDKIMGIQHFTEPPPRFTEASLVKTLEEYGIGRPSTYASIISTLQDREYVLLDKKRFTPTDVGKVVNNFLTEHFTNYVDYDFTANLETQLDDIAADKKDWLKVIRSFWDQFIKEVKEKSDLDRTKITQKEIGEDCPKCGKPLLSKLGKRGNFVACSGYPDCDFTKSSNGDLPQEPKIITHDESSKEAIYLLVGPYGPYLQLGMPEEGSKIKPKRTTIPPEIALADLDESIAKKLISLPRDLGEHPETSKPIIANIGRFGPYVNHNGKFKSIPKTENIFEISHEYAVELLKPLKKVGVDPETNSSIEIYKSRFGFYMQMNSTKVNLSKDTDLDSISIDKALKMLTKKAEEDIKKKEAEKKAKKLKKTKKVA
ncbi:type I DNA topoisomerase [Methylophilaceae bacterium]|nr:type I DNA topoisomerase [Methylophilaceae bacterium]